MSTDPLNQRRVNPPPPVEDPALRQFLRDVADELNKLPPTSTFSFTTPESNVTASPGTWGYNVASSATIYWLKQSGYGNTGWVSMVTA